MISIKFMVLNSNSYYFKRIKCLSEIFQKCVEKIKEYFIFNQNYLFMKDWWENVWFDEKSKECLKEYFIYWFWAIIKEINLLFKIFWKLNQ